MAWYPDAVKRNIPPPSSGIDPPITARIAILHVAATEADSLYDYFNGPSGGVESHFYVKYNGVVEQYRDTAYQADANMDANDFAISIESQGLADGKWTDAQIASIEKLLLWIHTTHSVPLSVVQTWDGSGVGYHTLFESHWDKRNASCPGPNRIIQFNQILVPWMEQGGATMAVDQTDAQALWTGYPIVKDTRAANPDVAPRVAPSALLEYTAQNVRVLGVQVAALSAAVKALSGAQGLDPEQVLAAVRDETAKGVAAALAGVKLTLSSS